MRSMSFRDLFVKSAEPAPATSLLSPSAAFDSYSAAATPDSTPKGSIDFILDDASHAAVKLELSAVPGAEQADQELRLATPTSTACKRGLQDAEAAPKRKKRKARICKEPGCDKYVVDHGLCIRHGGGKRCNVEGCNCRAQNRGLCWKHGGYTICKVDGCAKRAKSRGICWSHGGGTRCKTDGCSKIAVSLGRCWAHGGGKRCSIETCRKPASERTNNFCTDHYAWYSQQEEAAAAVAEERRLLAQPMQ
ncbi:WRKY transcription factor 19 [Phytophthora cinnamomi]|uniref:WRKY transcription factor 19 n=1 Tax=Phytophthora cinnamomi TaxID=4785 RepID=UPI00355A7CFE|nr:WRKY transcription factor 19 [Phytophthora cinnamomi]